MSASQRIIPVLAAATVGVATGIYIFDPLLRQYAHETGGTFRTEDVSAPLKRGASGSNKVDAATTNSTSSISPSAALKGLVGSETARNAEDIRNKAALNAASRAAEAARVRAEKTGDGKIF